MIKNKKITIIVLIIINYTAIIDNINNKKKVKKLLIF